MIIVKVKKKVTCTENRSAQVNIAFFSTLHWNGIVLHINRLLNLYDVILIKNWIRSEPRNSLKKDVRRTRPRPCATWGLNPGLVPSKWVPSFLSSDTASEKNEFNTNYSQSWPISPVLARALLNISTRPNIHLFSSATTVVEFKATHVKLDTSYFEMFCGYVQEYGCTRRPSDVITGYTRVFRVSDKIRDNTDNW